MAKHFRLQSLEVEVIKGQEFVSGFVSESLKFNVNVKNQQLLYYPLAVYQCKQINLLNDHVYALSSTMVGVYFLIAKTLKLYLNFVLGNNLSCETLTHHIYFNLFFLVNAD